MVFLVSFMVTFLIIKGLYPLAIKIGLVDLPSARKHHSGTVPLIGGIAIFMGFLITVLIVGYTFQLLFAMLLALTLIVIIGVIDDYKELSFKLRLLVQAIAALVMVLMADVSLVSLGNLMGFGDIRLGVLSIPFTVFAVIGSINAFNMMDGIDGLSASLAVIALLGFYFVSSGIYSELILILIACLSAFLMVNLFSRAKVFMGDAGSMLIGFIIAWFAVYFSQHGVEDKTIHPVTSLWLIAIPLMDTVCIMLRRFIKGQSPFMPDREHLHHIFLRAGYSDRQTLTLIVFMACILAAIGLISDYYQCESWIMFASFLLVFMGYFQLIHHSWLFMRWLKLIHKPSLLGQSQ